MYFSKFARQVTMVVRGNSLSDTMSQYLENQINATKNIALRFNSNVVAVEGAEHCETLTIENNKTGLKETVPASALLIYAGAIPRTDWLAGIVERDAKGYLISGQHLMREGRRPTDGRGSGSFISGDECSGNLCRGGRPASLRQRRYLRSRGGRDGGKTGPRIFGPALVMDAATLQQVRSTPLFAGLTDEQLDCIQPGEIIELQAGTVLVSEGDRAEFFYVNLEGQVRITRMYDRQEFLWCKQAWRVHGGNHAVTGRSVAGDRSCSKTYRLFRLDEKNFWRMLTACQSVAREIFRSAATRMRNMEGYSQQREKLVPLAPWRRVWRTS